MRDPKIGDVVVVGGDLNAGISEVTAENMRLRDVLAKYGREEFFGI